MWLELAAIVTTWYIIFYSVTRDRAILQTARVSLENTLLANYISHDEGVHYVMCRASAIALGTSNYLLCLIIRPTHSINIIMPSCKSDITIIQQTYTTEPR